MKRSKNITFKFFVALLVIFGFVLIYTPSIDDKVITYYQEMTNPETLDDLIAISHYIVVGKVENEEQFSVITGNTYKYQFLVNKYIKGEKFSERIDVFLPKNAISVGNEYLLFLSYWESELYPNPIHGPIEDNLNYKIEGNSLIGNQKYIENMDKEELIDYITNSPLLEVNLIEKYNVKDEAKNLEELINYSDYIVHVKAMEVRVFNKNVSQVGVIILEKFKGERLGTINFLLPADIKEGKEYLLFLKDRDSTVRLSTRKGSVIEKKDKEQWDEIMSQLKGMTL